MDQTKKSRRATEHPSWAVKNPYLSILAPRFFDDLDNCNWSDLARRVVRMFTMVEGRYTSQLEADSLGKILYELLQDGAFLPNSPVMMNSEHGQFHCEIGTWSESASASKVQASSRCSQADQ